MNITFVGGHTAKAQGLVTAIAAGARSCGDEVEYIPGDTLPPQPLDCDFMGLYGLSRVDWLRYCIDEHRPFLYFDKGYRRWESGQGSYWRVGLNETHPAEYISSARHNNGRVTKMQDGIGIPAQLPPWRNPTKDGPIVITSSSPKFHELHNLPPPREWTIRTIRQIREHTSRPIFYRPKPTHGESQPIDGARSVAAIKHLSTVFKGCHALITYGSYTCVDAMLAGVPSIVLGNGVIRGISSTSISEIEAPRLASDEERFQVLSNLAWCQYTMSEWINGIAWRSAKRLFINGSDTG